MNTFIKRLLLFIVPLVCFLFALAYIDPFNFFREERDAVSLKYKKEVSTSTNARLYKLIEYERNPAEVVILGDSRTDQLKSEFWESHLQKKVTNMSFGGGTLPEIISAFHEVAKSGKIKEVYIGVSFNLYNQNNSMNLVPEAANLKESALSYLASKYCFKAALKYGKARITGDTKSSAPPFSREEFWEYQLFSSASNFYRTYTYPQLYYKELADIVDYCKKNDIKIVFIIPPTHTDLQKRIADFSLSEKEAVFKNDLRMLGEVYDFDTPNELTSRKENFIDPFHSTDSISQLVVAEVTTGKTRYAKVLPYKIRN